MRELNRERFQRLTPAQARQRVEQREKQLRLDDDDDQPQQHQPREQA
jgi:hypothetical protein